MRHCPWAWIVALVAAGAATAAEPVSIEAEAHAADAAKVYRDGEASGGKCALLELGARGASLLSIRRRLPAGTWKLRAHVRVVPVELMHELTVALRAGAARRHAGAMQLERTKGYQPLELRFVHDGGAAKIRIGGSGSSGFDGMRAGQSKREKKATSEKPKADGGMLEEKNEGGGGLGGGEFRLEEAPHVDSLSFDTNRLVCDRLELVPVRVADAVVADVEVEKIHYKPGASARATATLAAPESAGKYKLVAELRSGATASRRVAERSVSLEAGERRKVEIGFELGSDALFGHGLVVSLERRGETVHENRAVFGVSENVYRIGITGDDGPQDKTGITEAKAAKIMRRNKRRYANYFEVFAWAPCDYSELTPEEELFYSGQTQYAGTVSSFKNLLSEAHERGIKGITYGKRCAGGIAGFRTYRKRPSLFGHGPARGPATQAFNTFYLDLMRWGLYRFPDIEKAESWQHWANIWVKNDSRPAVRYGAREVIRSAKKFGWDGIRWDGHFDGHMALFERIVNEELPDFVHGYNAANTTDPKRDRYQPPTPAKHFHQIAEDHGLIMDEGLRNWSHSNFSPGTIRPFYEAITREADYVKRIGGLPLFITFDMASGLDKTFNILCGLAAGERYAYDTNPDDFAYGPLAKFLTRYSAFVWDDTKRLATPGKRIAVRVGDGGGGDRGRAALWWRKSTWLRRTGDARYQLLVNLLNPPGYDQFCDRVQPPPQTLSDVRVSVATPDGAELERAFAVSPDWIEGLKKLGAARDGERRAMTLPRVKSWAIAVFEYETGSEPGTPFALTTPVKSARQRRRASKDKDDQKKQQEKKSEADEKTPHFRDFERSYNVDPKRVKTYEEPASPALRRDGVLDVHHARGVYAWLTPVEAAMGLLGGGRYDRSWVDRVGFKLDKSGSMTGFPDGPGALLEHDVLVLDNVHAVDLGPKRRLRIRDFVKHGGGLLVTSGTFNLSMGADRNTSLEKIMPLTIEAYDDVARPEEPLALEPAAEGFFGEGIDWAQAGSVMQVDRSPVAAEARVLARAGEHPAIVSAPFGEGRVVVVMIQPHGAYPDNATPYFRTPAWPRIIEACLRHLGEGAQKERNPAERREPDPDHVKPSELVVSAWNLGGKALTRKIESAIRNMVDAKSARTLLQVAIENRGKLRNRDLLGKVIDRAAPFVDASFTKVAGKMVEAQQPFVREAGYRILGLAGDPTKLDRIAGGLSDEKPAVVRAALVALGHLGKPAAKAPIRQFLERRGADHLLAQAVLVRLGHSPALEAMLPLYAEGVRRHLALRSTRRHVLKNLTGGTSFKLTSSQRRKLEAELKTVTTAMKRARFDVRYARGSVDDLSKRQLGVLADFLVDAEKPWVASLGYRAFGAAPAGRAAEARKRLREAKLRKIRVLAAE